jgi:hypothetical protein
MNKSDDLSNFWRPVEMTNDLSDESGRAFYRKLDDETDLKLNRMTIAMEMWREAARRAKAEIEHLRGLVQEGNKKFYC